MSQPNEKKTPSVSWEQIVLEAMLALTDGRADVTVTTEDLYQWIESTEYLTDYGRSPDPDWHEHYPSYRASLQLRWQRMVRAGQLVREQDGIYRLTKPQVLAPEDKWAQMLKADQEVMELTAKKAVVNKIRRSQNLRDLLVNYYNARCQVCDTDSPYLIPTDVSGRYYVEVHHVKGLAEAYALQQGGTLVGMKVNGLENLTVLCPHHHAMVHHHSPTYQFDRSNLLWRHAQGGVLPLKNVSPEHAQLLKQSC